MITLTKEQVLALEDIEPVVGEEHDEIWDVGQILQMDADFQAGRNMRTDEQVRGKHGKTARA
jgi:hypothetical protein